MQITPILFYSRAYFLHINTLEILAMKVPRQIQIEWGSPLAIGTWIITTPSMKED
jgi:hypothetical protein